MPCKDQVSMTNECNWTGCQVCKAESKQKNHATTQTDEDIVLEPPSIQMLEPPSIQGIEEICTPSEGYDKVNWMFGQNNSCARCMPVLPHVRLLRVVKKNMIKCGIAQFDRNFCVTNQGIVHSNTIWSVLGLEFQRDFTQLSKILVVLDWIPLNYFLKQHLAPLSDSLRHILSCFSFTNDNEENLQFFPSYVPPHDSMIVLNTILSLLVSLLDVIFQRQFIKVFPQFFKIEMTEVKSKARDLLVFLNTKLTRKQKMKISKHHGCQTSLPHSSPVIHSSCASGLTFSNVEDNIEVCNRNQPIQEYNAVCSSAIAPPRKVQLGDGSTSSVISLSVNSSREGQQSLLTNESGKAAMAGEIFTSGSHVHPPVELSSNKLPLCSAAHTITSWSALPQHSKCAMDPNSKSTVDVSVQTKCQKESYSDTSTMRYKPCQIPPEIARPSYLPPQPKCTLDVSRQMNNSSSTDITTNALISKPSPISFSRTNSVQHNSAFGAVNVYSSLFDSAPNTTLTILNPFMIHSLQQKSVCHDHKNATFPIISSASIPVLSPSHFISNRPLASENLASSSNLIPTATTSTSTGAQEISSYSVKNPGLTADCTNSAPVSTLLECTVSINSASDEMSNMCTLASSDASPIYSSHNSSNILQWQS